MTRPEKVAVAQRLRTDGWKLREIAERMGVAITTVDTWLSDPDLSKQRQRRERYAGRCVECGAPTNGSDGPGRAAVRCHTHQLAALNEKKRKDAAERRARVEALWANGLTGREIQALLGSKTPISTLRARGYDLPYRYPPEHVAAAKAGGDERLAKARAARRGQRVAA